MILSEGLAQRHILVKDSSRQTPWGWLLGLTRICFDHEKTAPLNAVYGNAPLTCVQRHVTFIWASASLPVPTKEIRNFPSWNTDQGFHTLSQDQIPHPYHWSEGNSSDHYMSGPSRFAETNMSVSVIVGTRKMVNYVWVGWSQTKVWWRFIAILTCKSFVISEYRGERLIEPSSSWFSPKFPSG